MNTQRTAIIGGKIAVGSAFGSSLVPLVPFRFLRVGSAPAYICKDSLHLSKSLPLRISRSEANKNNWACSAIHNSSTNRYTFTVNTMPQKTNEGVPTPEKIHFATGNNKKLQEVVAILADGHPLPFEIDSVKLDLPELQGEPEDIAKEKCRLASQEVGGAVMVEDTCLCFNALKGLPGPYIKWFLEKCGHDGLNRMLDGFEDRTAYAQCTFAYTPGPEYEPLIFIGRTHGAIVPARGPTDFGWDPIFLPDGFKETYAEMEKSVKNTISHRYRALDALRSYLLEHASVKA